jgi:hypothetical protein
MNPRISRSKAGVRKILLSFWTFVMSVLFALPASPLRAERTQFAPILSIEATEAWKSSQFAAIASTPKNSCIKACRARYRDCVRLKQISSSECRGVYQDCTNYTCAGSGPG